MAQGRTAFSGKPGSSNQRPYPEAFALIQAAERFLSGRAEAKPFPTMAGSRPFRAETVDNPKRWVIAKYEKSAVAQKKIPPGQRRRINAFASLLTDGTAEQCEAAVRRALDTLGDPQSVAETLLAPAARAIGEGWCADACSFVGVTLATSRLQRLLRMMIAQMPPEGRRDPERSVLLAPAPGEQHAFGLAIVDDAFRRGGWEVDCCGFGEEREMLRLAATNCYPVIGMSIGTERLLPALRSTIGKLRMKSLNKSVIVIAGGSLVIEKPQAVLDAGFDFVATSAHSAVELSESVLASRLATGHASIAAE